MSIIKQVTLQKIVAHDFRYDPRRTNDYGTCLINYAVHQCTVPKGTLFPDTQIHEGMELLTELSV